MDLYILHLHSVYPYDDDPILPHHIFIPRDQPLNMAYGA